nr:pentatricopeptide repeat-containing protein [Quercus suber]
MPDKNIGSWNAMINGLAKRDMIEVDRKLFNKKEKRDEISWTTIINGYIKGGYFMEALEIYNKKQREKIRPRKYVLSSVLTTCAHVGALNKGRWIHAYVKRNFMHLHTVLRTALVDLSTKCGRLDMAWKVFEDAIELFSKMQRENLKLDGITFVGVLNACSISRMVDEGLAILDSMNKDWEME